MPYVIKHPKFGVYIEHEMTPRFTWKRARDKAKKFSTKQEAEGLIALFDMKDCTVEQMEFPSEK
jgi:hypothetical protein